MLPGINACLWDLYAFQRREGWRDSIGTISRLAGGPGGRLVQVYVLVTGRRICRTSTTTSCECLSTDGRRLCFARFMAGSGSPLAAGMQPGMLQLPGGAVRALRPQMGGQQMMLLHQRAPAGMVPVQQPPQNLLAAQQQVTMQQQQQQQQQMPPAAFSGYGAAVSEADGSALADSFKFGQEEFQNMMTYNRSNSMPY